MTLKQILFKESVLVFGFCMAVLAGPCLSILFQNDLSQFTDCNTYLGLAQFDFEQSAVRRYRLIIPMLASALNYMGGSAFDHLAPTYYKGDFSLAFSFFAINSVIMAFFGLIIYKYCLSHGLSKVAALIGLVFVLSSRYTYYFAALPFVDSLFCLVIGLTLLGIKNRDSKMLICCIFLGPFAKESFIFIAPLIFFFGSIPKSRQLLYFTISGFAVFSYHCLYDYYYPPKIVGWLMAEMYHFYNFKYTLALLFSFYGAYKMLINIGLWIGLPLLAWFVSEPFRKRFKSKWDVCKIWFLVSVLFQMLLSGSMERMFYLALPVFAVAIAMSFEGVKEASKNRQLN